MKIIEVKKTNHGVIPKRIDPIKLYETDHAKVMHVTFQPGEAQSKHINNVASLFYFLEGNGKMEVNGEFANVKKCDFVESPANSEHCIYNDKKSIMSVLVIKVPHPRMLKKSNNRNQS